MSGGYIPHYNSIGKQATPRQTFIWLTVILVPIIALFCALAGAPVAGVAISLNPEKVASIVGPILCPVHTATEKLVAPTDNSYNVSNGGTAQDNTSVVKCYDAQGTELPGKGDSFTALWFGSWVAMAALGGAVVTFNLLYIMYKVNLAHAVAQQARNTSTRGGSEGDEELEELKRLELDEQAGMRQKKA